MITTLIAALALAAQQAPAGARTDGTPPRTHTTVTAAGHPLAVWSRRPLHPRGAILLVHGRTWGALPDFDLDVPGESRSVMAALAARGYAAYAVDLRGYGGTPRDQSGWDTPERSVEDVATVLRWIRTEHPDEPAPALLGWSNGALVSQLTAQKHPELMGRLILYGYPRDPASVLDSEPAIGRPPRTRTTAADARSDFISPAVTSPRMVAVYTRAALKADPIRSDWTRLREWNQLDPAKVQVPTLLLQGEHDPALSSEILGQFFGRLGTMEKSWVTLQGGDHAALLEDTSPRFVDAVVSFLDRARPPR